MSATYRAFLSYSHSDARFASKLHTDLEAWRIDRDLVGRETPMGVVPRTLRPIFRDREDFAGGGVLSDATERALAESASLVVLCSPTAARSAYVNEEIQRFKAMGKADRIIPIIVAGEPGSTDADCFPPALTHTLSTNGEWLDETVELLAADARVEGDGRRRATAKVVAGLLGVPFDEIAKRAERAQRRRMGVLAAVAAVMCVLAVTALGFARLSQTRLAEAEGNFQAAMSAANSLLEEVANELIHTEGIKLDATRRITDRATAVYDQLEQNLSTDRQELKTNRIMALASTGKVLGIKGDHPGELTALREAESLARELTDVYGNNETNSKILAMVRAQLGAALITAGEREHAIGMLELAVGGMESLGQHPVLWTSLVTTLTALSMLLVDEEQLERAVAYGNRAAELLDTQLEGDPLEWEGWASLVSTRVNQAKLLIDRGDHKAALALLTDIEETVLEWSRAMPGTRVHNWLDIVQEALGRTNEALGRSEQAAAARGRAAATRRQAVEADAEDLTARISYASHLAEEGKRLAREGSVFEAEARFKESLETLEAMVAESPRHLYAQVSLETALLGAARILNDIERHERAAAAARRLLEIYEAKLKLAPNDSEAIQSTKGALYQLARAFEGLGALEESLATWHRLLALEQRRAADGEANLSSYLAETHYEIGLLAWRLSRREEAIPHYARYNELLTEFVAEAPDDVDLRIALGHGQLNLGELRVLTGDRFGALDAFRQSLAVRRTLVDSGLDDPERLTELAWAEARLAQFEDSPLQRWGRVEKLLTEADAAAPLDDLEEELLTVARIRRSGAQRLDAVPSSQGSEHPSSEDCGCR